MFSDPFEMVAEIFYYDFDKSAFGTFKRSNTVNTRIVGSQASVEYILADSITGQEVGVESSYHSDYSSFALAGIFLNVEKMKTWASYKYIVDLLSNLLKDNPHNREMFENPDGEFRIGSLKFEELLRQIDYGNRSSSLYEEYIKNLYSRKQNKLMEIEGKISFDHTNISQVQEVCQKQLQEVDSFVQNELGKINRELIEFGNVPGPTLDNLNTNLFNGLLKMYADIEKLLYDILAEYNSGGITVATQMLDRVKALVIQMDVDQDNYRKDVKRLRENLVERTPEHPEIQIDRSIEGLLQRIQDCDEIPWVFPLYKDKAKKYYDRILSREIDNMNREIRNQIGSYFNSYLNNIIRRFEVSYKEKVGELVQQYRNRIIEVKDSSEGPLLNVINPLGMHMLVREFRTHLTSLKDYFKRFEESLRTEITISLNRKMILDKDVDKDNLYQNFIRRLSGDDWFASQISNWYLPYVNDVHNVNEDLSDSMEQFVKILIFYQQMGSKVNLELKPALRKACRSEFDRFMEDRSVLDQLVESIRTDETYYRQAIGNMLDNFNFRLALSLAYTQIKNRIETTSMVRIVGLPEPNPSVEQFLSGLGKVQNIQYHGSNEGILFYSETFGFPLFMLRNIENLRSEFAKNCQASGNNKYHRYTDIVTDYLKPLVIPQSSEDMQMYLHCWEVLYEAIALRVIQYEKKNWAASIANPDRFDVEESITFGRTLEAAIMKLKNTPRLLEMVKDITSDRFANRFNNKDSIAQIWYALYSNYEDVVKFINDQFQDNKPKIPQEYVLQKLLTKYLDRYSRAADKDASEGRNELTGAYQGVVTISSGYKDLVHQTGVKIYPNRD